SGSNHALLIVIAPLSTDTAYQHDCGGWQVAGTRKPPADVGGPASVANRAAIPDPQEIENEYIHRPVSVRDKFWLPEGQWKGGVTDTTGK
ncbi:hypothetical protein FRC00_000621, partial [Tulasnella sp. 408]